MLVIQLVSSPSDTKWQPNAPVRDILGLRAKQIAYTHALITHIYMHALQDFCHLFNTLGALQAVQNPNYLAYKKEKTRADRYF